MNFYVLGSFILVLFVHSQAAAKQLKIEDKPSHVTVVSMDELLMVSSPRTLKVLEHHEKKSLNFRVVSLQKILDHWRPNWRKSEEILFTCADGYQPSVPVSRLLDDEAYLAYEIIGRKKFEVVSTGDAKKKIELGPFYLVWDNLKNKDLQKNFHVWPYQIVQLEFIKFQDKFPHMAPPANASKLALNGFVLFRQKCMSCHAINGQGGLVGPELNYPYSVTEYFQAKMLKKWILDPESIRKPNKMSRVFFGGKQDQAKVGAIIAYLEAMTEKKVAKKGSR